SDGGGRRRRLRFLSGRRESGNREHARDAGRCGQVGYVDSFHRDSPERFFERDKGVDRPDENVRPTEISWLGGLATPTERERHQQHAGRENAQSLWFWYGSGVHR